MVIRYDMNHANRKAWMSIYFTSHVQNIIFPRIFSHLQNRNFIEMISPFGNSFFPSFFFLLKQLFRELCLCSKKKMLSHTTIVIINFFPHSFVLTLETSSKSLDIIMCSTKWYEKKRHSQKKRNVSWSFSLIYIFISLFNISQTKKEIRKEESNKKERRKGKRPSNFDWI